MDRTRLVRTLWAMAIVAFGQRRQELLPILAFGCHSKTHPHGQTQEPIRETEEFAMAVVVATGERIQWSKFNGQKIAIDFEQSSEALSHLMSGTSLIVFKILKHKRIY